MSIASGSTLYPVDYDLFPSGTGTATIAYVADEQRDPNTGVILVSGDTIIGKDINAAYTIINQIENILGLDPQLGIATSTTVSDRIAYLEASGNTVFVKTAGDTMTGALRMSGSSTIYVNSLSSSGIAWANDGNVSFNSSNGNVTLNTNNGNLLVSTQASAEIDANNITLSATGTASISAPIATIKGDIYVSGNITPLSSSNLGSGNNAFSNVFATRYSGSGAGVSLFGATLILDSGTSVDNAYSGVNSLGSIANPFSGVYAKEAYFSNIFGMSPIGINSDLAIRSGVSITLDSSGTVTIGSDASPLKHIYADNLIVGTISGAATNFVNISGGSIDGVLVMQSGATVTSGTITLGSGVGIILDVSGTSSIGSVSSGLLDVWTSGINGRAVTNSVYNEQLSISGPSPSVTFLFAHAPLNYTVFASGVYQRPGVDFNVVGDTATFIVAKASDQVYASFYTW
jgi:hypothetical protein